MALKKVTYKNEITVIKAENLNDIQDAIIALEQSVPPITEADNGKVIMVVGGAMSAVKIDSAEGAGF